MKKKGNGTFESSKWIEIDPKEMENMAEKAGSSMEKAVEEGVLSDSTWYRIKKNKRISEEMLNRIYSFFGDKIMIESASNINTSGLPIGDNITLQTSELGPITSVASTYASISDLDETKKYIRDIRRQAKACELLVKGVEYMAESNALARKNKRKKARKAMKKAMKCFEAGMKRGNL